jgi:hypothetical protein
MMGRMGSQARATPGKKRYGAPRIIFGGGALLSLRAEAGWFPLCALPHLPAAGL